MRKKQCLSHLVLAFILALNTWPAGGRDLIKNQGTVEVPEQEITNVEFTRKSETKDFVVKWVKKLSRNPGENHGFTYWKNPNLDLKKSAIILMKHGFDNKTSTINHNNGKIQNHGIVESDNLIETYVLHKEGRGQGEWSPYLVNTQRILMVMLGGEKDLAHADIRFQNHRSVFIQSLVDIFALAKKKYVEAETGAGPGKKEKKIFCRFMELNPKAIKPPGVIIVKPHSYNETFTFTIHKKNTVLFRMGLTASHLDIKNFKIEDKKLVLEVENQNRNQWKANLILMLNLHLPRDTGRLDQYEPWQRIPERIGICAGVMLSKDPLDKLFLGLSYSLYSNIDIIAGLSWHTEVKTTEKEIGDIQSVQDALAYADRGYSKPKFFMGMSFAPAYIGKLLGL